MLIPMDLQMFAGEQVIEHEGQTIELVTDEEPSVQVDDEKIILEDGDDEEVRSEPERADQPETEEEQQEEQEEVNPVAKAVIAERKKWQVKLEEARKSASHPAIQRFLRLAGVSSLDELNAKLDAAEAAMIAQQRKITPEEAKREIESRREMEELRKEIRRLKYESEVRELKKDPFFADIDDYREEYEEIAERTGQTLEEVYMAKRGRIRMKEYEREIEQRLKANREKKEKVKIDTTENGEKSNKTKIQLTPEEKAVARAAGLTEEEYFMYKKKRGM